MHGTIRVDIKSDLKILIVLKDDQRSEKLTEGMAKDSVEVRERYHVELRNDGYLENLVFEVPKQDAALPTFTFRILL